MILGLGCGVERKWENAHTCGKIVRKKEKKNKLLSKRKSFSCAG